MVLRRRVYLRAAPSQRPARSRRPAAFAALGAAAMWIVTGLVGCTGIGELEEWTLGLVPEVTIGAEPVTLQTAFYMPTDLGFDYRGNVFVLDSGNHRVQVFDGDGRFLRTIGAPGAGPGELGDPQGMFVHPDGRVWVADTRNRRIQPFAPDGTPEMPLVVDFFPLDLVVGNDRLFVQRMPQASLVYGPDPKPLIAVFDRNGNATGGFVDAVEAPVGILYMLENMLSLAPGPGGGVAVTNTHFASRIRAYGPGGSLLREIPVLYKAGAWAPLGRRPTQINDSSIERIARTSADLAWDEKRRLFWVLAGYVDRTAEGEWIVGREVYRYDGGGAYRGSVMLPHPATSIATGPDGRFWMIDGDGVVRAYRLTDPDMHSGER